MGRWELPSSYNVGDEVCLQFGGESPIIRKAWITKVIFTRSKVLYDVEIAIYEVLSPEGGIKTCVGNTRIHSVDSAFVKPLSCGLEPKSGFFPGWNPRSEYPDTNRLVECRYTKIDQLNFFARVKWEGGGMEWFDEQGTPIRDAVQFEWTEVKRND